MKICGQKSERKVKELEVIHKHSMQKKNEAKAYT